jgi:hypothetical protein
MSGLLPLQDHEEQVRALSGERVWPFATALAPAEGELVALQLIDSLEFPGGVDGCVEVVGSGLPVGVER